MVLQEMLNKTAEGTANFIVKEFKKSMTSNILGKLSSLINIKNLNKVKINLIQDFIMGYFNRIKFTCC